MDNGASSYLRFLNGNEDAFEEIMREYRDGLTYFIFGFVRDTMAAEDVAIDVFTYVYVNPRRFDFSVSLKTYLYMLGRSRALDWLRRNKRARENAPLEAASELADGDSLEDAVIADERKRALSAALVQLPEDMRTAVHLFYFEELSYDETARVMKLKKKQVDNLLYRAKCRLRDIIGEGGRSNYEKKL